MTIKNIKISDFPSGYVADELLAHAIVAHWMVSVWSTAPRMEMRAHICAKLSRSAKNNYGDEHMKLVEQAVHLEADNPVALLEEAVADNSRTLWFYYLLAFELAQVKGINSSWVDLAREKVQARITEMDSSGRFPLLSLLHYDCGLTSNMRWSGGDEAQMRASLYALLEHLAIRSDKVWVSNSNLVIPHGYSVVLTTSEDYGTNNVVVEVNNVPTLVMDANKDYVLWTKEASWALLEYIQLEGGATCDKPGRITVQ
ncbi:MAG: hypothetical protein OSB62_00900 [Alphaproteobacteria bacterium]|nr:hypothetical protein [Alphaproteobacteria bacterium]